MQQLDPLTIPLQGLNLIQASAGTGKTYTISLLYLRLLIELELSVDKILVVTYTRAATSELRERILARLRKGVRIYEGVEKAEGEYEALLKQYPANPQRLLCLRRALLNFDEAAVYTIHGFCQRALQENAFDVGMPFESEFIADEQALLLALTDQFWHRKLLKPITLYTDLLKQFPLTPDSLLDEVKNFIGKPYLRACIPPLVDNAAYQQLKVELANTWQQIRQDWQAGAADIKARVKHLDLKQTSYKPEKLNECWEALDKVLLGQGDKGIGDKKILATLAKLTPDALRTKGLKKNAVLPDIPFLHVLATALDLAAQHQQCLTDAYDQLRYDLLLWLRESLPQRKLHAGLLAFDDLLVNLQQALRQRDWLAEQLSERYQVALIDEFQDTDPIQYDVFRRMYANNGILFFVGDPKQAIYSFRGADIYTYLRAAEGVDAMQQYTLNNNFRSAPPLLAAFNQLFSLASDPFRNQQRVRYEKVKAGRLDMPALLAKGFDAPLRFWEWQGVEDEKISGSALEGIVAAAVASDIAQLLIAGQQGKALIGKEQRAVESCDIAILVRSHQQGSLIKRALQKHGIVSVQQSPEGIFVTKEAQELRVLLAAIAEPSNEAKLRRAIAGELMAGNADLLHILEENPNELEGLVERVYQWHQLWQKQGFMAMFRAWLISPSLMRPQLSYQQHILSFIDGERRLTNLLHLAELLHTEIRQSLRGMQSIVQWLQQCKSQTHGEEEQLRLESDEALVQIVTIHKSKGLQYPIVYCPFLWQSRRKNKNNHWFTWYDSESGESCLQASQTGRDSAYQVYQEEEASETLRLLYVALTRAEYHCTVVIPTGAINAFCYDGALYWLLYSHLPQAADLLSNISNGCTALERQAIFQQELYQLVAESQGTIQCQPMPEANPAWHFEAQHPDLPVQLRTFRRRIPQGKRIGSFSGLTRGQHDERPDYDEMALSHRSASAVDFRVFPAGAMAGVCLHKLLEECDFTQSIHTQSELLSHTLAAYGFDLRYHHAALQLLEQTLTTPLMAQGFCLKHLPREQRLDEMEFYFPVKQFKLSALQRLVKQQSTTSTHLQAAVNSLSFQDLQGFMKGFVDLIFEHKGRYYIVDYKSNRLGEAASDYTHERMQQAVFEAHYYLQYWIYSVALRRYLRLRLDDFHWERHFGGVFYLFLRGMQADDPAGHGIYFDRPSEDFIMALDALMQ